MCHVSVYPCACAVWTRLLEARLGEVERAAAHDVARHLHLGEDARDVDSAMRRSEGRQPPFCLVQLARGRDRPSAARLVPRHGDVHEALVEVPLGGVRGAPDELQRLVGLEVAAAAYQIETACEFIHGLRDSASTATLAAVATILLCGVDLFFRGKLDALLSGHRLITVDHTESPDLVIVDISRVDAEEVADTYADVPILGYTNHTDTAGLRAAHAAGFDQVVVKSALVERCRELVAELTPSA
jgi:hypothetical protein